MAKADRYTEYVSIDDLVPADVNPKGHADEQLDKSIKRFGYTVPIMIDERTGKMVEGHGRLDALKAMRESGATPPQGITEDWKAPVLRGWSSKNDEEAAAYLVGTNQLTILGGWENKELLELLDSLDDLDGIGFSSEDLDAMLKSSSAVDGDEWKNALGLANQDASPFTQMTFSLTEEQAEEVKRALVISKQMGEFDSENPNANGNAIARICESFVSMNG